MRYLFLTISLLVMFTHSAPGFAAKGVGTNRLHTQLMKLPVAQKQALMRHLINRSGKSCSLVQVQKFDRFNEFRAAIHVVICAEGTYAVVIKTDDRGTTDVIKIRD